MRDFFDVMLKDLLGEGFTRRECVRYGVCLPLAALAVCCLAELITKL